MDFLEELGALGAGIIMAISVAGLFWKADEGLSKEGRADLSQWLGRKLHLHSEEWARDPPNLPDVVSAMFTKVFGRKHLSWRCFLMSSLFSLLAVCLLYLLYCQKNGIGFLMFGSPGFLLFFGSFAIVFNVIPDYFSLLETRVVMHLMGQAHSRSVVALLFGADLLLTLLIFLAAAMLFSPFFLLQWSGFPASFERAVELAGMLVGEAALTLQTEVGGILGIFLYSTFFTSLWVWLTALGWGATRLLAKSPPLLRLAKRALPIETHPMRSIGEVAAVIVCLGYWSISAVTWITSSHEAQAALGN